MWDYRNRSIVLSTRLSPLCPTKRRIYVTRGELISNTSRLTHFLKSLQGQSVQRHWPHKATPVFWGQLEPLNKELGVGRLYRAVRYGVRLVTPSPATSALLIPGLLPKHRPLIYSQLGTHKCHRSPFRCSTYLITGSSKKAWLLAPCLPPALPPHPYISSVPTRLMSLHPRQPGVKLKMLRTRVCVCDIHTHSQWFIQSAYRIIRKPTLTRV